jgi:hypothetical protein
MDDESEKQPANQPPVHHTMIAEPGRYSLQGASATLRRGIAIELTPEANQALEELMSRTGDSPSVLFRKALGLYKLAEDAKREGKAVGIATTPDSLETEFVGL